MKALILNSGKGTRMGVLTSEHPKCMTMVDDTDTILSRQLKIALNNGIQDFIITTGYFDNVLIDYIEGLQLPIHVEYVNNPLYDTTNYIYSIFCANDHFGNDAIISMHGDLVFEDSVFRDVVSYKDSCGVVSTTKPLPDKDFKASIKHGRIVEIGINVVNDAMSFQPLYNFTGEDWQAWMSVITDFVERGEVKCYAENALNGILNHISLIPFDVKNRLCEEIDNSKDLSSVQQRIKELGV